MTRSQSLVHSDAASLAQVGVARAIGGGARVVLYTSSDCWRGAGVSYVAIASALDAYGFDPRVIATNHDVAREFESSGIAVELMSGARGESWRLRRRIQALDGAAVIVDRPHDLRVGTIAVAGTRRPLIFRYNYFGDRPPADALVRISYRATLRELVFLSTSARQRVLGEAPFMRRIPATTIHEGIDASQFRPCRRSAAEFRAKFGLGRLPFLLAVGALNREKRYEALFDALRLRGSSAPPLVILGEGPEEAALRDRARQLALDVRFLGRIPRAEVLGAYNACTGLVHPGNVETFGLAVVEAMACGRAVIAAAGGALPEVIGTDGACGMLVAPSSAWDMAAAIGRLVSNPAHAERIGTMARERARDHFSITAMQRSYAQLVGRHVGYHIPQHR